VTGEIRNVACLFCGCLCDDLRITVEQGRVTHAEGACAAALARLLSAHEATAPPAEIDGSPTTLQAAVDRAANVLAAARAPLIYGLSRSASDGQRAAIALAEQIGATIDTPSASEAAASLVAYQSVGQSTCTLGEVRNRADFVLFWRCDPLTTHPRHGERYSIYPAGEFLPRGRVDRTIVVADEQRNATARGVADLFLSLQNGRDFETLWALRCRARGVPIEGEASAPASTDVIADVAARAKAACYGVVFYESKGLGRREVEGLFRLVTDLNAFTRFSILPMGAPGNVRGAENVLAWQTGYPCSVNTARGYPRYGPGEFSAERMLEAKEVDVCLLVNAEAANEFSAAANAALQAMPTIVLESPSAKSFHPATVRIRAGSPGVHHAGTAYRVDGVGTPLRAFLPSNLPSDAEVLDAIRVQLSAS
jgi:formylmethanofuran dehydrogenase subunit B